MKRLLKRILFLSIVGAAGLVAFRVLSRRRSAPSPPYSWSPPPPPPPALHIEVQAPETAETEEPPRQSPANAPAHAADDPGVVQMGGSHRTDAVSQPPALEPDLGWTPEPLGAGPAFSPAAASGESPQASQALGEEEPGQQPDFVTSYFDKLAETPDDELFDRLAGMAEPVLESAPEAPPVYAEPPPPEPPHTPEPAPEPMSSWEVTTADAPPAVAPVQGLSQLPASLEEALTELAPAPIVRPPRRTAESFLDEGNVYFNVGQYQLAIERYSTAVEMDSELVAAFYNRANARTRAGEFDGALSDYDRALQLQPFDADALNNRGMLHLYRANYPEALRDFNAALVIDPADTTVIVNRGLAHLHSGEAANARQDFREAATVDPEDAAAHYGASQASAVLGDVEDAVRSVARALELNPGYAREAAGDPNLVSLQGNPAFLKLLRDSGGR